MALFVNQQNQRTELQKRVAAELAEKAKNKPASAGGEKPDGVKDSAYMENTRQTSSLAWVWAVIVVVAVILVAWLVLASA